MYECGGGGLEHWDTASWNLAFSEAPWLIGGREVNSSVPKLYLIFIHTNAPGWDRLPQTNWNAWDRGSPQRGMQKKDWKEGGRLCVCVFVCVWLWISENVYKEGKMHWYGWKDMNHYRILVFFHTCINTDLSYLVLSIKSPSHCGWCNLPFKRRCRCELWSKPTDILMASRTISLQTGPPFQNFIFCSHEYPLRTHNQFLIPSPFSSPSLIKHTIK